MDNKKDKIYSITILDFFSKIYFFHKIPEIDYELTLKNTKNIYKSLKSSYLKDYVNKQLDFRLLDSFISENTKVKVTLLGELCIIVLYSNLLDTNLFNLHNQEMIEAFYLLLKTKKIKIEMISKKFVDVSNILIDTLYFVDPKIKINKGIENNSNIYFTRFNKANEGNKDGIYTMSSKKFINVRDDLFYIKNMKYKLGNTNFFFESFINKMWITKKNERLEKYSVNKGTICNELNNSGYNEKLKNKDNNIENIEKKFEIKADNKEKDIVNSNTNTSSTKNDNNIGFNFQSFDFNFNTNQKNTTNIINNSNSYIPTKKDTFTFDFDFFNKSSTSNTISSTDNKQNPNTNSNINVKLPLNSSRPPNEPNFKFSFDNDTLSKSQISSQQKLKSTQSSMNFDFLSNNLPNPLSKSVAPDFNSMTSNKHKKQEDIFSPVTINNKISFTIFEKGILLYNKSQNEKSKFKGKLNMDIKNNFNIKYKKLFLEIEHNSWNNNDLFFKCMNKTYIKNNNLNIYDIELTNVNQSNAILEYTPDSKIIDNIVKFNVNNEYNRNKKGDLGEYILNFSYEINSEYVDMIENGSMDINIIAKDNILSINEVKEEYKIEDKSISFNIDNFHLIKGYDKKIVFNTDLSDFIELIKINLKIGGMVPSKLNAKIGYVDDKGNKEYIPVNKKCQLEVKISL